MAEKVSPEHFHELDLMLQRQVKEIADQIKSEIKRISEQPTASSGNPALYNSLGEQILKIKKELAHRDYISALENAADKLKKAEAKAKNQAKNQDILADLLGANAELYNCRNVRG